MTSPRPQPLNGNDVFVDVILPGGTAVAVQPTTRRQRSTPYYIYRVLAEPRISLGKNIAITLYFSRVLSGETLPPSPSPRAPRGAWYISRILKKLRNSNVLLSGIMLFLSGCWRYPSPDEHRRLVVGLGHRRQAGRRRQRVSGEGYCQRRRPGTLQAGGRAAAAAAAAARLPSNQAFTFPCK